MRMMRVDLPTCVVMPARRLSIRDERNGLYASIICLVVMPARRLSIRDTWHRGIIPLVYK